MRKDWTIQMSAGNLREAAHKMFTYHHERLTEWESERDQAEQQLRDHGIEIVHHQVTGGDRAQAKLDPELAHRMSECEHKIHKHRLAAQEYAKWVAFFDAMPETQTLEVHHDDYAYFHVTF